MNKVTTRHWQRTSWAAFIAFLALGGIAYVTLRDRFGEWPLRAVAWQAEGDRLEQPAPAFGGTTAQPAPTDGSLSGGSTARIPLKDPPAQPPPGDASTPRLNSADPMPLPLGAPDLESVRAEVDANPHATAPSLLAFATEVARAQTEAEATPERLLEFAAELSACALESSARMPPPARSFCVRRYRTLAQRDPQNFASSYASLLSSLPPDLAERARQKDFP